jgi:hypothetical protein
MSVAKRLVPMEPLSKFLQEEVSKYGNKTQLGSRIGCSSSRIDDYINMVTRDGRNNKYIPRTKIDIDTVDKIACKLGVHLAMIYPDYLEWEPIED